MRVIQPLREFIAFESAGGILLAIAAAAALMLAILDDIGAIVIIAMFYAVNLAPVAFAILPLFAFANAGVSLEGVTAATFLEPVPLGIAAGLLAGKPIGVFLVSWLTVRLGFARLPESTGWGAMFGASVLCGVGFTMSLFIAGLAFEGTGSAYIVQTRLGILFGSLASALLGLAILRAVLPLPTKAR